MRTPKFGVIDRRVQIDRAVPRSESPVKVPLSGLNAGPDRVITAGPTPNRMLYSLSRGKTWNSSFVLAIQTCALRVTVSSRKLPDSPIVPDHLMSLFA